MTSRHYYPVVHFDPPKPPSWLASRSRFQRILIALAFLLVGCTIIGVVGSWVRNTWPDAAPFTMVGGMLLGMPLGSLSLAYCVGLIFEGKVRPW